MSYIRLDLNPLPVIPPDRQLNIENWKLIIISMVLGFSLFFGYLRRDSVIAFMKVNHLLPEPERLTALYFEDHLNLPKRVEKGKGYPFRFTIHNLEYQNVTYPYEISAIEAGSKSPFATGSGSLKHD